MSKAPTRELRRTSSNPIRVEQKMTKIQNHLLFCKNPLLLLSISETWPVQLYSSTTVCTNKVWIDFIFLFVIGKIIRRSKLFKADLQCDHLKLNLFYLTMEVVIKTDFLGADQRTIKLSFKNPVVWCSRYFICFDKAGTTVCCVFRPPFGCYAPNAGQNKSKMLQNAVWE